MVTTRSKTKRRTSNDDRARRRVRALRAAIDRVDRRLVAAFVERMRRVGTVGAYKKSLGLPAIDRRRERKIVARWTRGKDEATRRRIAALYRTVFRICGAIARDAAAVRPRASATRRSGGSSRRPRRSAPRRRAVR